MPKILVIEDDEFFRTYIQKSLESHFELHFAIDLNTAMNKIQSESYDLFLVDIVLPGGSGLDLCAFIRSQENLKKKPILVLSSKDEIQDKVTGLEFGADDYLIKPCHPKEIIARIKAHLRKVEATPIAESITIEDYKIDFMRQRVFDPSGNTVELTHIEFKLLVYFARHMDHVLTRAQILDSVWPSNLNVTERVVDTHVSNLRKKLGTLGDGIKSVHAVGYSFSKLRSAA